MYRVSATPLGALFLPEKQHLDASSGVHSRASLRLARVVLLLAAATAGISSTGCQVDVGGQTLPSGYYLQDDIQYFPAGPEFKLSKEAAAQKEFRDEQAGNDPTCTTCR